MTAAEIPPTPKGIAGPGGGYFHKHYGGSKATVLTSTVEASALVTLAGYAEDRDDFDHLVEVLGLGKAVTRMREQRHAS